ncbi:FMN-binding negative transcriptional regulator [Denitrobaculum tricleocarpae]|uniref:FMN-binding negative transcriptional regulator n=1 Tax=Denitrobaculum tricleocarpae TaxID=2591009 RepID=A0A545TQT5_9PROT|nr:FMN-binding negative transcriptional regulator [Denitrobaculum tricleocarpae]TQV79584.1 FMN-binding negative transcriptional regulator [Denitrobaculum tricleocarpae]
MFVPESFALTDPEEIRRTIVEHDFGLLVIGGSHAAPTAAHLPFLLDETAGPKGRLLGHMARPNRQWRDLEAMSGGGEVLVVFQGPHSYISPAWYGPEAKAVPTWNYTAVHVYGRPQILRAPAEVMDLLEKLVEKQESLQEQPWTLDRLERRFVEGMSRGIVCFEILITRVEAKAKLSQNKAPEMQRNAIEVLAERDTDARAIAGLMARNLAE